jgi:hypothetical protein
MGGDCAAHIGSLPTRQTLWRPPTPEPQGREKAVLASTSLISALVATEELFLGVGIKSKTLKTRVVERAV